MSSLEVNKVFGAVLTAGIAFMVTGFVSGLLVHPKPAHELAIALGPDPAAAPAGAPAAPAKADPILALLATANVANGQTVFGRQCAVCHTVNDGGRAGVGPNLYNIVNAHHAHAEGFNYSAAIRGMNAKPWSYTDLNEWLWKPAQYAPGTRMAYAGLANTQQRADVIAYLRSLAATPAPLPTEAEIQAAAAAAAPPPVATAAVPAESAAAVAAAAATAPAAPALAPIGPMLATANVQNGEVLARRLCGVCHTFTEGGRNGVGPNLWNVVGGKHAHAEGFNYSAANRAQGDKPWTYEDLNAWLVSPTRYMPGTRMAFAGVSNAQQRADIIAYLRTLSASPQPLP
ncbi:c-type cytochrome [Humitalea sp. 24SJ18S-53]|uniref:c-type cytochrome n=1 Tax=Humitalea sp. 24SJ18S-53 TaxID=3422307 RepID=UPI003D66C905